LKGSNQKATSTERSSAALFVVESCANTQVKQRVGKLNNFWGSDSHELVCGRELWVGEQDGSDCTKVISAKVQKMLSSETRP